MRSMRAVVIFYVVWLGALSQWSMKAAPPQVCPLELKESAAIYQLWMSGHNYENNARRARLLAKNFLAAYGKAADPQAKFVFKMGLEHVALGTTTVNTVDVGTLATSIARTNNRMALRIAFLPMGGHNLAFTPKPGNPTTITNYDSLETKEFFAAIGLEAAALPKESWAVVPPGARH